MFIFSKRKERHFHSIQLPSEIIKGEPPSSSSPSPLAPFQFKPRISPDKRRSWNYSFSSPIELNIFSIFRGISLLHRKKSWLTSRIQGFCPHQKSGRIKKKKYPARSHTERVDDEDLSVAGMEAAQGV